MYKFVLVDLTHVKVVLSHPQNPLHHAVGVTEDTQQMEESPVITESLVPSFKSKIKR